MTVVGAEFADRGQQDRHAEPGYVAERRLPGLLQSTTKVRAMRSTQVSDTLPAGVTNIAAAGPGGLWVAGQVATCSIPIHRWRGAWWTITGTAPAEPGPIQNVCVASADGGQPVDTTACDATTIVTENAPVVVTKVAENLADAGAPIEYGSSRSKTRPVDGARGGGHRYGARGRHEHRGNVTGWLHLHRHGQHRGLPDQNLPLVSAAFTSRATRRWLPAPQRVRGRRCVDAGAGRSLLQNGYKVVKRGKTFSIATRS